MTLHVCKNIIFDKNGEFANVKLCSTHVTEFIGENDRQALLKIAVQIH